MACSKNRCWCKVVKKPLSKNAPKSVGVSALPMSGSDEVNDALTTNIRWLVYERPVDSKTWTQTWVARWGVPFASLDESSARKFVAEVDGRRRDHRGVTVEFCVVKLELPE